MKILILWGGLLVATPLWAGADFLGTITPEERTALGLQKLAPEELARLEAAVQRYHKAEIATVKPESAAILTGQPKKPGWLAALITLQKTGDKPDKADAFETRIAGEFEGWTGHTTFKLENGQVWQQSGGEIYSGDQLQAPRVNIYPGRLGVYWMEVEGVRQRVKVKPIRLE